MLIKLYHSRFKQYMNDNIVLNKHPFLSLELKELEISSVWHFVDFDLQFLDKLLKFGMVEKPNSPNSRSSTVYKQLVREF